MKMGALLLLAAWLGSTPASAQCRTWSDELAPPGFSTATAVQSCDLGAGERLYIARGNDILGTIPRIYAWDGHDLDIVFESLPGRPSIDTLSAGDAGFGPMLFATETASTATFPPRVIYTFDGASWTQIGLAGGQIFSSGVYDDGTGPAFYVAGNVNGIDATPVSWVGKWTGSGWVNYGSGLGINGVRALASFDDGTGVKLYAASTAFNPGPSVFQWTGSTWVPLDPNLTGLCNALAVHDFGAGSRLYVAGNMLENGSTPRHFMSWNGTSFTAEPDPSSIVDLLQLVDVGQGPEIFLSTRNAPYVQRFDGSTLTPAPGLDAYPTRSTTFQDGSGTRLVLEGAFNHVNGRDATRVVLFDGTDWSRLGSGFRANGNALATCDMGQGEQLFACGQIFTGPPGYLSSDANVGRWDGAEWRKLSGSFLSSDEVWAVRGANVGALGPSIYVGGAFAGGLQRWNGTSWSNVGSGFSGEVYAFENIDFGGGPLLAIGGNFNLPQARRVTFWNGTSFSGPVTGLNNTVSALASADLGLGTVLYVGGQFTTAGGSPASHVASWNGTSWSTLGAGVNGTVTALCAFDDGSGPAVFAGGSFTSAGGNTVSNLAKWNGTSWSDVGGGTNGLVQSLLVHDDGRGPALYLAGGFYLAGGVTAFNIARWDGNAFEAVDVGLDGFVSAMASYDDDQDGDRELFVTGSFTEANGRASQGIARLEGCPHYESFCFGDGSLTDHTTPCPCANAGAAGHGCANSFDASGGLLSASGQTNPETLVLAGSGMPLSAFGIYLQHNAPDDRVFHDGVICAGGNLIRLRNRTAVGGASEFPNSTDTVTISQRGMVTPGSGALRYYSLFYRSASPTFCPPATANVTNGMRVIW